MWPFNKERARDPFCSYCGCKMIERIYSDGENEFDTKTGAGRIPVKSWWICSKGWPGGYYYHDGFRYGPRRYQVIESECDKD